MAVVFMSRYCSDLVIMEDFVIITEFEGGENIEVDVEDDGRLTISSIQSQFGKDVTGLRYKMLPLAIITGYHSSSAVPSSHHALIPGLHARSMLTALHSQYTFMAFPTMAETVCYICFLFIYLLLDV